METLTLPSHFPAAVRHVYLAQFENVQNGGALKEALIQASRTPEGSEDRRRMDMAFIDARLIVSRRQLITAIVQAVIASERRCLRGEEPDAPIGLKTPSIHSDILWTLNPNNNIADALRRFGVSSTTRSLILAHIAPPPPAGPRPEALMTHMQSLVDGQVRHEGVALDTNDDHALTQMSLQDTASPWKELGKVYKLQDTLAFQNRDAAAVEELICATVATKYIGN